MNAILLIVSSPKLHLLGDTINPNAENTLSHSELDAGIPK